MDSGAQTACAPRQRVHGGRINSSDPWWPKRYESPVMASGDAGTLLPIDAIDESRRGESTSGVRMETWRRR